MRNTHTSNIVNRPRSRRFEKSNKPLSMGKDFREERRLILLTGNLELLLDKARTMLIATELHRVPCPTAKAVNAHARNRAFTLLYVINVCQVRSSARRRIRAVRKRDVSDVTFLSRSECGPSVHDHFCTELTHAQPWTQSEL